MSPRGKRPAPDAREAPDTLDRHWPEIKAAVEARRSGKLRGLRTGLDALDDLVSGLDGVVVLGGLPGAGKTALALQLAWDVAALNDAVCLVQSAEMSLPPIFDRLARRALAERDLGLDDLDGIRAAFVKVASRISLEPPSRLTPWEALGDALDTLRRHRRVARSLVVIDSLHDVARRAPVGETFKDALDAQVNRVRDLADRSGATILLVAHQPKSATGHGAFAFSGSATIDYAADVTAVLAADDDGDGEERTTTLRITKNRHGAPGSVRLAFRAAEFRFAEVG